VYGKKVGEIEKSPNDSLIICEIGRYLSNDWTGNLQKYMVTQS
jgi:hypothetical protein